jgi:hypothetical protein
VTSKQLVSHINAWLVEEATIPIGFGWETEPSNMALDEGSPTAATESSSPIKLNLTHLSQNPEPNSTTIVGNRMSTRQRTRVTRNEDSLW